MVPGGTRHRHPQTQHLPPEGTDAEDKGAVWGTVRLTFDEAPALYLDVAVIQGGKNTRVAVLCAFG